MQSARETVGVGGGEVGDLPGRRVRGGQAVYVYLYTSPLPLPLPFLPSSSSPFLPLRRKSHTARNPQCPGQAFLLPVCAGDKQEIRSVKDKPFYCQISLGTSKKSAVPRTSLSTAATFEPYGNGNPHQRYEPHHGGTNERIARFCLDHSEASLSQLLRSVGKRKRTRKKRIAYTHKQMRHAI